MNKATPVSIPGLVSIWEGFIPQVRSGAVYLGEDLCALMNWLVQVGIRQGSCRVQDTGGLNFSWLRLLATSGNGSCGHC